MILKLLQIKCFKFFLKKLPLQLQWDSDSKESIATGPFAGCQDISDFPEKVSKVLMCVTYIDFGRAYSLPESVYCTHIQLLQLLAKANLSKKHSFIYHCAQQISRQTQT